MKNTAFCVLASLAWLLSLPAFSQDKIVKINNDTIRAKVVKITSDKIFFRYPGSPGEGISEIHKNSVKEIIYADGTRLRIIYNLYEVSPDMQIRTKRCIIKADLGAPFLNHLTFGIEYSLQTGLNLELKGGVIGPGFSNALDKAEGFLLKGGVKIVYCQEGLLRGQKYTDPMKGVFIKPEFIYSHFLEHAKESDITYTHYAINFILGKQFIFNESISLEFFGGLGAGLQSTDFTLTSPYHDDSQDFQYAYSHLYFGKELPLVVSGGLTVGFVF